MLEKKIESKLRSQVKKLGGVAWKFTSPGTDGVPDRIVLLPGGRIIFVECKSPEGKLSAIQNKRIAEIRGLGFDVRVVNSMSEAENIK